MAPRPGIFRPLAHEVPDAYWWIVLAGAPFTDHARLTGRAVMFAACGSPCWPRWSYGTAERPAGLTWCAKCFPGRQDRLDQQQRKANGHVGPDPGSPGAPVMADLRCPPLVPAALQTWATRADAGGTDRWVGWLTPNQPPTDPVSHRAASLP